MAGDEAAAGLSSAAMAISGYQRVKTVLNSPSSVNNAMEHVRAATECSLHRMSSN